MIPSHSDCVKTKPTNSLFCIWAGTVTITETQRPSPVPVWTHLTSNKNPALGGACWICLAANHY